MNKIEIEIEKTNREFRLLKWVLSAKANGSSRYAIKGVNFADNKGCCTDGKRLHIATFERNKFEDGTYEVITNTAKLIVLGDKIDGNFPEYEDIIPASDLSTLDLPDEDYVKQLIDGVSDETKEDFLAKRYRKIGSYCGLYKILKTLFALDITLSIPHILDVLGTKKLEIGDATGNTFDMIASTPDKPVQFSNAKQTAVIMSITLI